ncbi:MULTISPECIES: multidrug efflux MFS transporter periplasmic adaptor subunit EmrA [Serratia]|jgi:membrane fusion protein (multidrug efflux system)|uniref:Multidrug efflux MFS transporter periplasmic adaptor subunit EmrA n=1 Tax=Serratia fonticola TaxID=47917 RepID=A0AAP2BCF7_SERFO|nr:MULTISPECIES: multidrug efflux MFS transporter periplasmic adaptor subunit EmrA [Serratia]AKG67924.1 multidrug transporter [Serratia fonticola]ALX96457.1 multidrug transporter [Serratia fonticola]MBC3211477.1 multidrug efflux MFS transporter periplasmic adaptor subunit EmrA [Serratia fonticola]MBP1000282.1 multidrug efflux MFS transporter periplasmic adaptor subunit EmrA [Serratia fonticola]MBP1005331.1 multidrug efflux MFS transporter periplasmic adaptor subunit EmrA [Serratia fonticola]
MSASAETQTPQQPAGKKRQRKFWLLLLTFIFVIIGVAYLVYWFLVLRHHQETDDAYVAGNQVQIMAQVSGSVNSVTFDNTDFVRKGDVLLTLDPTDAEQAFERAKTALANSVRQTHQLVINGKQYQANIALRKSELSKVENDLKRRIVLGNADAIGREELQHARDAVDNAKAALEVAVQQYNANQAMVLNTPLDKQPAVLQAAAQMRDAWMALQRTRIVSPITGFVSRRSVQVGAQISPGTPLMAIVAPDHVWVDANFKETQIANMRIGQEATVVSDLYGSDVVFKGKVVGIDMGTGSAFSLLPAQNATGNWIKVVQRLPVRIELDAQQVAEHPLRIGLSTLVKVDTTNLDGLVLSDTVRQKPLFETNALTLDLAPVNQMIADVIHANAG